MNSGLLRKYVQPLIELAIAEDIGPGDITSQALFTPDSAGRAEIISKEDGIFCGRDIPGWVYETAAPGVRAKALVEDGDEISVGSKLFEISGPAGDMLACERIILNFLQRMCGISTETARLTRMLEGSRTKILDTRKTLPGFRHLDKYAVLKGGGRNHRIGLYDMVMIKDNHIAAAGGISAAVRGVRDLHGTVYRIEVETETLEDVKEALASGADIIMLDNMDIPLMKEAIALINGRSETEISGGITTETLPLLKDLGADYISIGALTHSVNAFDITMLIRGRV